MRKTLAIFGLLSLCAAGAAPAQTANGADVIETRQAGQELVMGTFAGIGLAAQTGADVKPFADSAAALGRWFRLFPSMFPPGSETGHNTKAQPAVWSDRAGFEKAAATIADAADKLAVLAKAGDTGGFARQVQVVQDDCKACHKTFRQR